MFRLDDKKAAVTGAGSGIGKAVALLFAKQGAEVYVIDLDEEAAGTTVQEIKQNNGKASAQVCDVSFSIAGERNFQ
jgi:NAD(P)-dependent dehydrogenase (short-subunit alcohol dehydrogenase family)